MTKSRRETLADILAEAEKLKMYRLDGTTYCEKCDNLVVRIQSALIDVNVEDLSADEIEIIKSIKEKVISEKPHFVFFILRVGSKKDTIKNINEIKVSG